MDMNTDPIRTASHIWLNIAVVVIIIWLIYAATHTTTENNRYGQGSTHVEVIEHNWPLSVHPCGAIFDFFGRENGNNTKNTNRSK